MVSVLKQLHEKYIDVCQRNVLCKKGLFVFLFVCFSHGLQRAAENIK